MGMIEDILARIDNGRRVAGRNVSDLWNDPSNALQKTAANTLQTVKDLPNDPANFLGVGALASSATRMFNMGLINKNQFQQMVGPGAKFMTEAELLEFEKKMFQEHLARQNMYRDTTAEPPIYRDTTR